MQVECPSRETQLLQSPENPATDFATYHWPPCSAQIMLVSFYCGRTWTLLLTSSSKHIELYHPRGIFYRVSLLGNSFKAGKLHGHGLSLWSPNVLYIILISSRLRYQVENSMLAWRSWKMIRAYSCQSFQNVLGFAPENILEGDGLGAAGQNMICSLIEKSCHFWFALVKCAGRPNFLQGSWKTYHRFL